MFARASDTLPEVLVRQERFGSNAPLPFTRLLYLSDLHFTARSGAFAAHLSRLASAQHPHLILLGGDYADTPGGRRPFGQLVADLVTLAPVLAVAGNHDYFLGVRATEEAVSSNAGCWIEGRRHVHQCASGLRLYIDGNCLSDPTARNQQPGTLRLLCAHRPPRLHRLHQHYDLMLAGHLHGGQIVLWQRGAELYPGRWLYRWNGLRYAQGCCRLLVSRGLGDTLPWRYRCPRELLSVQIGGI